MKYYSVCNSVGSLNTGVYKVSMFQVPGGMDFSVPSLLYNIENKSS